MGKQAAKTSQRLKVKLGTGFSVSGPPRGPEDLTPLVIKQHSPGPSRPGYTEIGLYDAQSFADAAKFLKDLATARRFRQKQRERSRLGAETKRDKAARFNNGLLALASDIKSKQPSLSKTALAKQVIKRLKLTTTTTHAMRKRLARLSLQK